MPNPDIVESSLEHRIQFDGNWIDKWVLPNPFISLLLSALKSTPLTLEHFSFRADAKNVAETALVISIEELRGTVTLGVDRLAFKLNNPDWDMAERVVELFDGVVDALKSTISAPIKTQESTLAFHVSQGEFDYGTKTAALVDSKKLGPATFYGINVFASDRSVLIQPSKRYSGGAFYRITRVFRPDAKFADIALALYADEAAALSLLDIKGVI
jgi:hypothetical protein